MRDESCAVLDSGDVRNTRCPDVSYLYAMSLLLKR